MSGNKKVEKVEKKYYCKNCDYLTYKKTDYKKHLETKKHNDNFNDNNDNTKNKYKYVCICGNTFLYASGLSRHRRTCEKSKISKKIENSEITAEMMKNSITEETVLKLIEQNNELLKKMSEMAVVNNITNNNNTYNTNTYTSNSNNNNGNHFNINMFLNEQCKDAMTLKEFIDSIEISFEHLKYTKENGLDVGITKLIMDKLSDLTIYERPIHCTDLRRETIYVKDENGWNKDIDHTKMKKAIFNVGWKGMEVMTPYACNAKTIQEKYKMGDILFAISKSTDKIDKKVISNICKKVHIKSNLKELDNLIEE